MNETQSHGKSDGKKDPEILLNKEHSGPKIEPIEGLPLATVLLKDEYNIVMGNHIVSPISFKTRKDALIYIDAKPWPLILNIIATYTNGAIELNNLNNKK